MATCPQCHVPLTQRQENHPVEWCPCCSSRWYLGLQGHWGSHNDWATYLCDKGWSARLRRFIWRHFGVAFRPDWTRQAV